MFKNGMVGCFEIKPLIIGAIIIVVVSVAMYLLKNVLKFGITFPIWLLITIVVVILVIIFVLTATLLGYLRFGKEGFIFSIARKKGLSVCIDAELGSDNAEFVLAEKASPKDVVLLDETSGINVDPGMLSSDAKPMRFPNGLDIYIYTYYNFMPQSIRNHAAFNTIEHYFKTQCNALSFLSMKEFIELISDPEHYLTRNAEIKLAKYFKIGIAKDEYGNPIQIMGQNGVLIQKSTYVRECTILDEETGQPVWVEEELSLPSMIKFLTQARQDISKLPICGGLIAGTEAFKNNSVSYSSQHLGHVLMLYYSKIMEENKGKIELLTYGIVGLMLLCGTGLGIYIISMAFGKK